MLVGIHQLHYLPWLRYFEKIAQADVFVVLDNIQYSKNGWQNRNKIKTPLGAESLTVPVHAHLGDTLDAVRVRDSAPWRKKHWKSIQQHYGKAPFFDRYAPMLEETYSRSWNTLNALNRHMLDGFLDALAIDTKVVYASELDVPGAATDRLVNLIQAVGGTQYYSGAFALEAYLDANALAAAGIELVLQEWTAPVYPQRYGAFVPDLAIIDLLMNCGPDARAILMGEHAVDSA
jgi:hypothetical protein